MSETQARKLQPLSRPLVVALYAMELALFVYFAYGAAQGEIFIPTKAGPLVLTGPSAWLACLFPIGFLGMVYFRFDPTVRLPDRNRQLGLFACLALGLMGLAAAVTFSVR